MSTSRSARRTARRWALWLINAACTELAWMAWEDCYRWSQWQMKR